MLSLQVIIYSVVPPQLFLGLYCRTADQDVCITNK